MRTLYRPGQLVSVSAPDYGYTGEAMSFVTPAHTVMVRRVIDHPGTLEEIGIDRLTPLTKEEERRCRWVHYAAVRGSSSFPVDMLRYDRAAPVNFKLVDNGLSLTAEVDPSFGWEELVIATCAPTSVDPWTHARWSSFLWGVRPLGAVRRGDTESPLYAEEGRAS